MKPENLCILGGDNPSVLSQKPIASLGLSKGQLLLTIDDGPNATVTRPLLDLLDDYNIKATFFVVGDRVKANANLIREMIQRGHTIGNHTYSHKIEKITQYTIVGEVIRAHDALASALGHEPEGRLLFRAPGLGWSAPKAINLNNDALTREYVGPIHANIGTDAPRADWSCWSKGVSAVKCASWYFEDIVNVGRGIVLSHDIFYKAGRGNTYEMLKILLGRLDQEAGGIANKDGTGAWHFVDVQDLSYLDQFEAGGASYQPVPLATQKTNDGYNLITNFTNGNVFVRSNVLVQQGAVTNDSKIETGSDINPIMVKVSNLVAVADLNKSVNVAGTTFKQVRVESARLGFEFMNGQIVYIFAGAFN